MVEKIDKRKDSDSSDGTKMASLSEVERAVTCNTDLTPPFEKDNVLSLLEEGFSQDVHHVIEQGGVDKSRSGDIEIGTHIRRIVHNDQ